MELGPTGRKAPVVDASRGAGARGALDMTRRAKPAKDLDALRAFPASDRAVPAHGADPLIDGGRTREV